MYARLLGFGNGDLQALYDRSDGFYRRQLVLTTRKKPAGRRVWGFLGIEAVTKAGPMHSMNFDSVRTYVHDGWD